MDLTGFDWNQLVQELWAWQQLQTACKYYFLEFRLFNFASYLYFILRNKIDSAKIRVIPFARTMGKSLIKNP